MAPIIRIVLRYITIPLIALGWILPHEQQDIISDPELVGNISFYLGLAAPVFVEGWYGLARKRGWKK